MRIFIISHGWIHSAHLENSVSGDWLTATFCYCKYPPKVDSSSGLAHWYQFEYYSKHSHNTTFILTSNCPSDYERTGVDCVPESGNDVLAGDSVGHKLCRTWPGKEDNTDQKKPHDNKLCYLPFEEDGDDFIEFNGEQRNLSPRGGQRPIRENQTAADEVCKGMCQEHLSMELLIHPHKMPSHQVTWTDLEYVHFLRSPFLFWR